MSDRLAFASTLTAEGRRIKGSVQLKDARTFRNGEWVEVDIPALMKADRAKAFASMEHDDRQLLGAFGNKTLDLRFNESGFEYETADLPNTSYANDALELVRGGYVTGSSFEIDGLRSSFSVDPDGTRVRRYTGIKRLISVSPVRDPAFPSLAAAFNSKGANVTEQIIEEPQAPPPPAPEPAKFTEKPKSGAEEWAATAEAFSTEQIEATMDSIFVQAKGDLHGELLDRYEGFAKVLSDRKKTDAETRARVERMAALHDLRMGRAAKAPETEEFTTSKEYEQAFTAYLRSTPQNFSYNTDRISSFAQTVAGDGTQGGFLVPDGFVNKITERLKAYGGIASVAEEITTSTGESLRWPYIDDTANKAQIVAEDTQATTGADLVFDSVELGAYEYDATGASGNPIEVSLTLLQDAAFDIEGLLTRLLGTRIGRKQADHFATGTGVNEPVGLLSKTADTMTATVVSLAAPEHIFQVDRAYRDGARWVMSDTTLAKVWTAQATTNEPLFQPGRTINGRPFDVLFGYPVSIDNSAGDLVAFGDINAGYIIRRVRGVQLLVDPYTAQKKRAVQYHAWARADANIQDPNAYSVSTWASVTADT